MKNHAFTLAEVLITLGIIGIVAALTIPTLMRKHQEMVLKQQFKKAYSVVQNALKLVYADNGYQYDCYYEDYLAGTCVERNEQGECIRNENVVGYEHNKECGVFEKEFRKKLKVGKECYNNAYAKGCIPKYKGIDNLIRDNNEDVSDYDITAQTSGCAGYRENNILSQNSAWVLADGTIIMFYAPNTIKLFAVDVNGAKGPNKWGYDLFAFMLRGDGNRLFLDAGGCERVDKGGITTKTMLKKIYE